jgi:hypothetical protein
LGFPLLSPFAVPYYIISYHCLLAAGYFDAGSKATSLR